MSEERGEEVVAIYTDYSTSIYFSFNLEANFANAFR